MRHVMWSLANGQLRVTKWQSYISQTVIPLSPEQQSQREQQIAKIPLVADHVYGKDD